MFLFNLHKLILKNTYFYIVFCLKTWVKQINAVNHLSKIIRNLMLIKLKFTGHKLLKKY